MGDLPTPLFPALHLAAQMLESFNEEALDMVRLQPLSLGALHLQAQLLDLGLGHGVVRQRTPLEQLKRSEEHTSELQSLMRISYAVFCLKKKTYQHSMCHNAWSTISEHNHG